MEEEGGEKASNVICEEEAVTQLSCSIRRWGNAIVWYVFTHLLPSMPLWA